MPDDGRAEARRGDEEDGARAPVPVDKATTPRMARRARRRAAALARTLPEPGSEDEAEDDSGLLPVPASRGPARPQPPAESPEERERRIAAIQRDLARRRRRRAALLFLRLFFFVLLPTGAVGNYYFNVATEMYETKSEFVIQKTDAPTAPSGGLSSIFSGFGMADAKDSIAVQGYLMSQAAMDRLDAEQGFIAHFQQARIDEIQRLPPNATRTEAFELYRRNVIVGYDLTEGILRMSVIAADRETSERFSRSLVSYAEEMVDNLSTRAREENMRGAEKSFQERQADVSAAAANVLELQRKYATFSAEGQLQVDLSIIQTQTLEAERMKRELNELLANPKPNRAQAETLRRQIEFVEKSIAERRAALTESGRQGQSLAEVSSALQMAQSDLAAKEQMRVVALGTLEQARIEAQRQVRYLSVNVPPVAPDRATYPRRMENTAVAFFIFLGLYVMVSLTLSILREQVSV